MAVNTDVQCHVPFIPEELYGVRAVRIVAASAIKFLPRPCRVVGKLFCPAPEKAYRVAGGLETGDGMRCLSHIRMAVETYPYRPLQKQGGVIRGVGRVTTQTHPLGHRLMDIFPAEFGLVMTVQAKRRRFRYQEFFILG